MSLVEILLSAILVTKKWAVGLTLGVTLGVYAVAVLYWIVVLIYLAIANFDEYCIEKKQEWACGPVAFFVVTNFQGS